MMKPPVYTIKKIKPGIDFKTLSPSHFVKALPLCFKETVSGKAPRQKGEARLVYSNATLFAWFDLEEATPIAALTRHDDPLYTENVVELFIDPLGLGSIYYEIEVNPLNASFDAIIINDIGKGNRRGARFQGFTAWNPKSLKHRSIASAGKWQVFLSVDFADLFLAKRIPPKKGDVWQGNILRIDFNGKDTEYCAWSPTRVLDFHNTNAFGKWVFE